MQFMLVYFGPAAIVAGQPHAAGVDGTLVDLHQHFVCPMDAAAAGAAIAVALAPPLHPDQHTSVGFHLPSAHCETRSDGRHTVFMGLPILRTSAQAATHADHACDRVEAGDTMDVDGAADSCINSELSQGRAREVQVGGQPWLLPEQMIGDDVLQGSGAGGPGATAPLGGEVGKVIQVIVPTQTQKHRAVLRFLGERVDSLRSAALHVRPHQTN